MSEEAKRGFDGLLCPLCGCDGIQSIDLDDCDTVRCAECNEEYRLSDTIAPLVAAWQKVLNWVATAPEKQP